MTIASKNLAIFFTASSTVNPLETKMFLILLLWESLATLNANSKFMKGSECKDLIPEVGKVYDFNGCIDTALNELEI